MEQAQLQKVLAYIEEHLRDDGENMLDNTTLAKIANYSEYHFLRLFHKNIHLTPADYIRKRRISEIVRRIGESDRPISDIAFEYGFNSKENFTRAFKKEHHILPTEFRAANCSLRLFEPFEFDSVFVRPQISIGYLEDFVLIAYPSDEESPPNFWNKYNAEGRSARLSGNYVAEDFAAMVWNRERNRLDYYIGVRKEKALGNVDGTVRLQISGGLYAIFDTPPATQHDFVNTIRRIWDWIYGEWLPNSGYRRGKGYELESYTESSKKYSERIYIPIVKE